MRGMAVVVLTRSWERRPEHQQEGAQMGDADLLLRPFACPPARLPDLLPPSTAVRDGRFR